jgi:hypothetical protein
VVEAGLYNNPFVHRVATRGGIWGFFCYACRMCHLIATATRERATPWVRGTVGSVVVCRVFDSGVDGWAERTGDGGTKYPHRYAPPTSACPLCLPTTARRGCSPGRPPRLFRERGNLTLSRSSNACTLPATGLGGGTSPTIYGRPPRGGPVSITTATLTRRIPVLPRGVAPPPLCPDSPHAAPHRRRSAARLPPVPPPVSPAADHPEPSRPSF